MPDGVDRILDQWAAERPELDVSPIGIVGRIHRLAKTHHEAVARNLAGFDLTPDEFDVLAALRRSGPPYAMCPRDLIDSMMVRSGTVSHRLAKLEDRGLIRRDPDPEDRRSVIAVLETKGRRLVDRAMASHLATEEQLIGTLNSRERDQLARLLRRLSE